MIRVGERVEFVSSNDPYTKLERGAQGTVTGINTVTVVGDPFTQVSVAWDDGSKLMMIPESGDRIRTVG